MSILKYTIERFSAFIEEIERLHLCDFPYIDSKIAIETLKKTFDRKSPYLYNLREEDDKKLIVDKCTRTITDIDLYLPLLGFILRSTDVRNPFEIYGPILRLVNTILNTNTNPVSSDNNEENRIHLILSSEWNYSPLIYSGIPELPGFLFIGLPVFESSNPLLIPLIGHEMGHLIWNMKNKDALSRKAQHYVLESIINRWDDYSRLYGLTEKSQLTDDIFGRETWQHALKWALEQTKEIYCDFIGLSIFGYSFLCAFAYLLSPRFSGSRSELYPNLKERAEYLTLAAEKYDIKIPADYLEMFENFSGPSSSEKDMLLLTVADEAVQKIVPELIHQVDEFIRSTKIILPSKEERDRIYKRFLRVIPAEQCKSIADILNAAWKAYEQPDFWKDKPQMANNRDKVLKELVLKNIEIFEIEQITGDNS